MSKTNEEKRPVFLVDAFELLLRFKSSLEKRRNDTSVGTVGQVVKVITEAFDEAFKDITSYSRKVSLK